MRPQSNNYTEAPNDGFAPARRSAGNAWMIVSIIAIVIAIGLGIGFTFFFLKSTEDTDKISAQQETISKLTTDLGDCDASTGDPISTATPEDIDFKVFYDAMSTAGVSPTPNLSLTQSGTSASSIKTAAEGKYQIATFAATAGGSGWVAYFYRALPSAPWTYSKFSGQTAPSCSAITQEELAAFQGIVTCTE